jgi:hypothetical protein
MAGTDVLTTSDGIAGTNDDPLFQTMRVGEMFRYRFTLTPGDYRVRLLFAEIYWESGDAEKEDVFVSGRKVLSGYNIFDEAGHDVAVEKEFTARPSRETLDIRFIGQSLPMHSGARACGIEIVAP